MSKFQNLSAAEKMLLAEELWDSALEDESSIPLSDEHRKILEERLKAYELNPNSGSSWDEVKKRIMDSK
ncbi:MAG: addiction module protein [Gammaproteobacteria bacterium]|nr:addiction module protein [Gammaproteobacteria bacterium]